MPYSATMAANMELERSFNMAFLLKLVTLAVAIYNHWQTSQTTYTQLQLIYRYS